MIFDPRLEIGGDFCVGEKLLVVEKRNVNRYNMSYKEMKIEFWSELNGFKSTSKEIENGYSCDFLSFKR